MKKTYKIKLPKGANISTVETNENNGVLEVTVGFEKKYVPKDGDVVSCQGIVVIYAGTNETGGINLSTKGSGISACEQRSTNADIATYIISV